MAIDDLLDEHEQSERVRGWLRNNGSNGVPGGCSIAVGPMIAVASYRPMHRGLDAGRRRGRSDPG